jgi:hypothetical protein
MYNRKRVKNGIKMLFEKAFKADKLLLWKILERVKRAK